MDRVRDHRAQSEAVLWLCSQHPWNSPECSAWGRWVGFQIPVITFQFDVALDDLERGKGEFEHTVSPKD